MIRHMKKTLSKDSYNALRALRFALMLLLVACAALIHPSAAKAVEKKAAPSSGKILINFVDVDIISLAGFISKITGKNIIYDSNITGKVTIVAPSKIDTEEAFDIFTSVLKLKGYAIVYTAMAYKIIPAAEVKQGPLEVLSGDKGLRRNEEYMARVISLNYVQSQDVLSMLQPLVSREGYIASFAKSNALLVVDSSLNIDKILKIVAMIDAEPLAYTPEIVYLKHSQAESVGQSLKQLKAGRMGVGRTDKAYAVSEAGPIADKRLNAIILYGSPEENAAYRKLIAALDVPSPETSSRVNVYYLENADAAEVAKVLEGLTKQAHTTAVGAAPGADTAQKLSITADKSTNSLIITASPEEYQSIVQVVQKLDRRPKQVFVEAMITEVSINKTLELGAKWRLAAEKDSQPVLIGGTGSIDTTTVQSVLTGMAGLTLGGLGNLMTVPLTNADGTVTNLTVPGFAAMLSLSDLKDVINVLSTPNILTSDNKEAEIIVGENVPFLSKLESTAATTGQTLLQSIERKDVGITLRIKPQISEGGYIKLDIYQEISALETASVTTADVVTTKRSAKTSVVVKDKQTVVIGGLIQDKETKSVSKVPLLGDIPFLGWLFKSTSTEKQKTNLLVFLTPTIVNDFDTLNVLKDRKQLEFDKNLSVEDKDKDKKKDGKDADK
ncbi:MAG: type II secretion system secretin GspD [Deltaproteobacteria bacterium]|nr:type II secretion system secretin GspD [Deltaproteobacteria bacterium]